jgi:O-antigen/teichoic acid export membrane protein
VIERVTRRVTFTLGDQVVSSMSNFLVGVCVARLAGPRELGAFTLAYVAWLTVVGMHRALVTDPLLIEAGAGDDGHRGRIRGGIAAAVLLGAGGGLVALVLGFVLVQVGARSLGQALLALSPWLVFLLVQDCWRWVAFMRGEPAKALANDVVYLVVQIGTLFLLASLGHRSAGSAIVAWGVGALWGSVMGLWQFGVRPGVVGGRAFLQQAWPLGRWLLTDFAASFGATQAYLFVAALVVGPAGLGVVRAAQGLMGPTNILVMGGSSLALPSAVRARERSGWEGLHRVVVRSSAVIGGATAIYALVVVALSPWLMGWVYGTSFQPYGYLLTLVAIQYLIGGLAWGAIVGLKASRSTRPLPVIRLIVTIVSLTGVVALGSLFDLAGVGWAGITSSWCLVFAAWIAYVRARDRRVSEAELRQDDRPPVPSISDHPPVTVHVDALDDTGAGSGR